MCNKIKDTSALTSWWEPGQTLTKRELFTPWNRETRKGLSDISHRYEGRKSFLKDIRIINMSAGHKTKTNTTRTSNMLQPWLIFTVFLLWDNLTIDFDWFLRIIKESRDPYKTARCNNMFISRQLSPEALQNKAATYDYSQSNVIKLWMLITTATSSNRLFGQTNTNPIINQKRQRNAVNPSTEGWDQQMFDK